jgi:hypothetical protein
MRVFVSSTVADLAPYRQVAQQVMLETGWHPVMPIEHKIVAGGPSVSKCQEQVLSCRLFLSIAGFRCGWIPTIQQGGTGTASMTEIELGTWLYAGQTQRRLSPLSSSRGGLIMLWLGVKASLRDPYRPCIARSSVTSVSGHTRSILSRWGTRSLTLVCVDSARCSVLNSLT